MKKNFLTLSAFCLLLSMNSCYDSGKNIQNQVTNEDSVSTNTNTTVIDAEPAEQPFAYETISVEQGKDTEKVHFKYNIDFPQQGPEALNTAIKQAIFQALGDSSATDLSTEKLKAIADRYMAESKANLEEGGDDEFADHVIFQNTGDIKLMVNTDKYLTYFVSAYHFAGGAHGISEIYYLTFDKANHKLMKWDDLFPESHRKQLGEIVEEEIVKQYYQGTHEWDEVFKFALPQQAPAFTSDGMMFIYSSYEIDCYAAGLPKCIIPYEKVLGLMTSEAQALLR